MSSLDQLARDAGAEVRDRVATIEAPTPGVIARRSRRGRVATGLAAIAVLALAGGGLAVALQDDSGSTGLKVTDDPEPTTVPAPGTNGWVAHDSDGDIYLVRPGEDARRLEVAGSDTTDEACPTWSPDGTRLSFGRVTVSYRSGHAVYEDDAALVIVSVGLDGAIGAPNVIALDGFHPLPDFDHHPCATWAPDGRWVAFVGSGDVWVADTHTGAIRRLPDLRPTDLEWRPGTDELAIAGDIGPNRAAETSSTPVTIYSVSTGELRQLGSVRAAILTWSPDGSTLAYQGGENDTDELWLVDADGANERVFTHVGSANHGVGPVWSPTGERIAYQRLLSGTGERHEVVLVNVADGNETVIGPPETDGPNGPLSWYPSSVTWSPDGTTLLYSAWSEGDGPTTGVLAVRADTPTNVTVLTERSSLTGFVYDHSWVPVQMWGRQPG
jgi:Tol biopolymer transport system component